MYAKPIYVFRLEEWDRTVHCPQTTYYAISLTGSSAPGSGGLLSFQQPQAPQAGETPPSTATGFSCLFNAAQLPDRMQRILHALPMFRKGGNPVYLLPPALYVSIRMLFEKMLKEMDDHYVFKYELLVNYLSQLIHQALKLQPDMNRLPRNGCRHF